jgi:hypothetical protein
VHGCSLSNSWLTRVCRGCLLVRQSFFHNNPSNFVDLGGGVMGCRGFHSSFRATQSGLSLNIGMLVNPVTLLSHLEVGDCLVFTSTFLLVQMFPRQ